MQELKRSRVVDVFFPVERDVEHWAARHANGEVPGRWPYGLDQMAAGGFDVNLRSLQSPSRRESAISRLGLGRYLKHSSDELEADTGLAWDENTAIRMVVLASRQSMFSGTIWATDKLAGRASAELKRVRSVLREMDGVFVNCRAQLDPLRNFLGHDGPAVEWITLGIDVSFWRPSPFPAQPLILSVGGDRDRDSATLFAAFAQVISARPDVKAIVQTTSSEKPPRGVTVVQHFTHLALAELYSNASVVAVATKPNLHGSGTTVSLEAMASARPVVLSAGPAMNDYIDDGVTGWLTPVGDPRALSERILRVLADPAEAEEMGLRARAAVEDRMTSTHLASGLVDFMDSVPRRR